MQQPGVITEQGFVAGSGLGFNALKEEDLNPNPKKEEEKKDQTNEKKPSEE